MTQQKQGVQRVNLGQERVYVAYAPLRQANWSIALVIPTEQVENQLNALNTLAMVVAGVLAIASMIGVQQLRLLEQAEDRSTELAATNSKLQQEVQERQRAEAALLDSQAELENRVAARTAELATANQVLQTSEAQLKQQAFQLEQALQELQQTQTHLIQTEKMSSLGQMIAGVAHEINNPVNFIYANLPYAEQYMQDLIQLVKTYQAHYPHPVAAVQQKADAIDLDFLVDDLAKVLESMQMGTERIRQLVLSLRNFSRLDEAEKKEVNIHEGIDNTLLILQNRLKPKPGYLGIQIVKDYSNPYPVECYPGQLNQVFMNILANAIDALEPARLVEASQPQELSQNSVTVATDRKAIAAERESISRDRSLLAQEVDAAQAVLSCPLPTILIQTAVAGDEWIEIRIADNGSGMPEEIRRKVFDPFFTTKPVGKGTGIGMSISYQIVVEKHGGQLFCHSAPGAGTEFVIRIPARQSPNQAASDGERLNVFSHPTVASHDNTMHNSWVNPPIH
ncbi:MAG: ATPase [Oscillatoriales cyanobacterium C42_A2020_001]|nr:ATPase [Leptolyngbyaceae cyanobacterium C42_A2020_001]